jgi:predicted enzyme related to lactoylglutathione lyase
MTFRVPDAVAWGLLASLSLAVQAGPATAQPAPAKESAMPAPIVFFDIAGPDLSKQAAFYQTVFGWRIAPDGRMTVQVVSPLPGTLRVEPPQQGPIAERIIYLGVPDITATLAKVTANGGAVVFPRLEVPGVAVVGLFTDPAGNRMGLVEMDGERAKVPK